MVFGHLKFADYESGGCHSGILGQFLLFALLLGKVGTVFAKIERGGDHKYSHNSTKYACKATYMVSNNR